ncbi:carbonic anhydrase [Aquiluna sp. KACHI24]|uniref:carbonic anhydrase n=1 Tax=Aquiluna sp. KACHI24 TaxID=2968831 RepID=UPI0022081DCB|nr:carbonic anhydrase [Aquiluna sp. KACHI24]BDQ00606.1 carbonic anhydrase [Aquiluna sp. KACHI24]
MPRPQTAREAWQVLESGNANFVAGTPAHPRQDADVRLAIANRQKPFAALFGCSDSRLAAEMIFDVGLGDLFVVRNAGQVIAETILGSLEFAVEVLKVPLILVLAHDECGAIRSTMNAAEGTLSVQGEFIHNLVDRIMPTVQRSLEVGETSIDEITDRHVRDTITELLERSKVISDAVKDGKLAVVGANYKLELGEVHAILTHGQI